MPSAITSGEDDIDAIELDIFLGENYIVTHHDLPIQALNRVWDVCTKDVRHFKRGADHVLYKLTDELIVDYMQVVEALDEEIEMVEDEVIGRPISPRWYSAYLPSSVPLSTCAGCYPHCGRY